MHKKTLCDICKEKVATVHYTEIVDNKLKKMDLCEDCARDKNIGINVQFSVADILKGLTESQSKKEESGRRCPGCGITFNQFRKTGKLGCGKCYETFEEELMPIISDIHKNTEHVGTKPSKARKSRGAGSKDRAKLDELTSQLEEAIDKEEYEQAAVLRDKIRTLQQKIENKAKGPGESSE